MGVAENLGIGGDWFVYNYVIAQAAHRFGDELLLWDQWGAMGGDLSQAPTAHVDLVDEVSGLLVRCDDGDLIAEHDLLSLYREDERLHPGPKIYSASPYGGYFEVALDSRTSRRLS